MLRGTAVRATYYLVTFAGAQAAEEEQSVQEY